MSFVILTSKPGQFRTELTDGLRAVEAWEYLFGSTVKARFVIAELAAPTRIRVIDEVEPPVTNSVPSKFLVPYPSVEAARGELQHLTRFGSITATLRPVAP
jgi:hypothetical protein